MSAKYLLFYALAELELDGLPCGAQLAQIQAVCDRVQHFSQKWSLVDPEYARWHGYHPEYAVEILDILGSGRKDKELEYALDHWWDTLKHRYREEMRKRGEGYLHTYRYLTRKHDPYKFDLHGYWMECEITPWAGRE